MSTHNATEYTYVSKYCSIPYVGPKDACWCRITKGLEGDDEGFFFIRKRPYLLWGFRVCLYILRNTYSKSSYLHILHITIGGLRSWHSPVNWVLQKLWAERRPRQLHDVEVHLLILPNSPPWRQRKAWILPQTNRKRLSTRHHFNVHQIKGRWEISACHGPSDHDGPIHARSFSTKPGFHSLDE